MSGRLRAMPDLAKNSDILVAHNAIPDDATGVAALLHMTPSYIGSMAKEASVKKFITHPFNETQHFNKTSNNATNRKKIQR